MFLLSYMLHLSQKKLNAKEKEKQAKNFHKRKNKTEKNLRVSPYKLPSV